ncbi:MAG: MmcQ/YjbR family DNA-binding protein [Saprospiraceae bacterium]|nr:MmcQ/YjbR family DNA-binding protein [Saprospiraceae bacterium]
MNIESLRKLCLSFPGVTEDIKWESDLCFLVGGKMFCVTPADVESGVSFKVKEDEFRDMLGRKGIIPAPYMARYKWVYVLEFEWLTDSEWEHFIRQSYELVKEGLSQKIKKTI